MIDFVPFAKIARFSRDIIVTEKIDGTNAQIYVSEDGTVTAGSRTRWITPEDDNFGFAAWVRDHVKELRGLGPGSHFGEWWGAGIQRRYGLTEKRFSLFNVSRWGDEPQICPRCNKTAEAPRCAHCTMEIAQKPMRPACCSVVPVLWRGNFDDLHPRELLEKLRIEGSAAAPGFMKPEGIVIFHHASGQLFKKTLEKDEEPKTRNGK